MEKKITKKFYYLSALNIIPAMWMGKGLTLDSLVLIGFIIVLVINHTTLVRMVNVVSNTMTRGGETSSVSKILFLFFAKIMLVGVSLSLIYLYDKNLLLNVFILVIFQLIIQVVSIKNNY